MTLNSTTNPNPQVSAVHMALAWVAAIVTGLYMLPWAIAATRQRPDTGFIAVVNFLLGWTIIGWIYALIKACSSR